MNSIVDGLRQTSKGQLVYTREIGGKALAELFHECTSAPLLSSPHTETSLQQLGQSVSFGLSSGEDNEEEEGIHTSLSLGDHQYSKDAKDCECGHEKGERDSLEIEVSNRELGDKHGSYHQKSPQAISPKAPQILSPKSPQPISPKGPQVIKPKCPQPISQKSPQAISPKSPQVVSLKNAQVMKHLSASVSGVGSGRAVEEAEGPQVVTPRVKHSLDSNDYSESRLKETNEEEVEKETRDTGHEELTVSFTEKLHVITGLEMDYDNRSKEMIEKKQHEFLQHQTQLDSWQEELVSVVEKQQCQEIRLLYDSMEEKKQSRQQEVHQAVQKVKESHQHCSRRQDARLRKVEQLDQQLKEEKAKKVQAMEQKLGEVRVMAQKISAIKTSLVNILDQCPHKQHLSEVAEKTKLLVRKLSDQAEMLAGNLTRDGPLDDALSKLKQFHEQSQNALDFANNLTVEAEKKAKAAIAEAERQRAQAASAQQPQPGQGTSQAGQTPSSSQPVQAVEDGALAAVVKEYENNARLLLRTDAALDSFVSDQQFKRTRFDLQRAVNTPVNAISPVNSAHLRDKFMRVRVLLKGERVEVMGKQVTAQAVPQGVTFCKNLVAKMIARKADEQVSSNHESAFAIAAVAVGLWTEFPDVGDLIMAHLQALCPYVLPFYPPRLPNQSMEDYHRSLGYKIDNGTIEQQDKFLRRMSGVLRLYGAIMVTSPPQGVNHAHPHGLEHAWVWLTRSLNLQPNPDITATAIYDILSVTGSFLLRAYRIQFVKLLYFLFKVFLPKLKDVAAGSGPVIRLETFLETTMKNNAMIPEPEGYLPSRFWQS